MDQKQFEATLADAENRMRRLRMLYDQWFHGLERTEPRIPRQETDRVMALLRNNPQRNTALRFRYNQLVQRYTTYTNHWQRISRQIEEGTYKRDVARARRRFGTPGEAGQDRTALEGYELDIDVDLEAEYDAVTQITEPPVAPTPTAAKPAPPKVAPPQVSKAPPVPPAAAAGIKARAKPPPPANSPNNAPASTAGGVSDDQIASIYKRYMAARRDNSERVDNVKLESLAKTVREMMPKLTQKHAGKQIDFDVVVKDGKVALKPVAK